MRRKTKLPHMRTMRKAIGIGALSLALFASSGAADTLLTYVREAPEMVFMDHVTGGRETIRVLLGPERLRVDEPRRAIILRRDEGKLWFITDPLEKKGRQAIAPGLVSAPGMVPGQGADGKMERTTGPRSFAIRFPVKLRDELPAETYQATMESEPAVALRARTVATGRTKAIGRWKAAEHRIEILDPAGSALAAATVWTTADLTRETFAPLEQLNETLAGLNPRRERLLLAEEIGKLPGVPVRVETTFDELAGKVTRTLQLTAIEEKAATPADYEQPKDTEPGEFIGYYGAHYHDF